MFPPQAIYASKTKFHLRRRYVDFCPQNLEETLSEVMARMKNIDQTHFRWFREELRQKFKVIFGQIGYFQEQISKSRFAEWILNSNEIHRCFHFNDILKIVTNIYLTLEELLF